MPHLHRAVDGEWVAEALRAAGEPLAEPLASSVRRSNPEVGAITSPARADASSRSPFFPPLTRFPTAVSIPLCP